MRDWVRSARNIRCTDGVDEGVEDALYEGDTADAVKGQDGSDRWIIVGGGGEANTHRVIEPTLTLDCSSPTCPARRSQS